MAATNLKSFYGFIGLGKQFVKQIQSGLSFKDGSDLVSPSFAVTTIRAVHASVYEKNLEDNVCPSIVPDNSTASYSEAYWAPHPQTGIFGPPIGGGLSVDGSGVKVTVSVLEQKIFIRPLEILDKPVEE